MEYTLFDTEIDVSKLNRRVIQNMIRYLEIQIERLEEEIKFLRTELDSRARKRDSK